MGMPTVIDLAEEAFAAEFAKCELADNAVNTLVLLEECHSQGYASIEEMDEKTWEEDADEINELLAKAPADNNLEYDALEKLATAEKDSVSLDELIGLPEDDEGIIDELLNSLDEDDD